MFDSLFTQRGLSLERIRVLIEVRDAGSIAQAAPNNPARQSQYSRQLRELAEFFGCEVTQRRGKILRLSAEGERLADIARPFLRELTDFHATCQGDGPEFTIAGGDSLIQWLVIPRLGMLQKRHPKVRFTTLSLRTNEIVRQVEDGRVDFGLIRKNAFMPGMKAAGLGILNYIAVVPEVLTPKSKVPTFSEVFTKFPFAMQTTDGQFSKQLLAIATAESKSFLPSLGCQSFPQTLAAVRSGRFAAVIPELAVRELPTGTVHRVVGPPLRELEREVILMWNPRITKVRAHAVKLASELPKVMRLS